jgi:4-hydroxythreonine-4-phosphate dehydrogenase
MEGLPVIAITMGDPAGIGPELSLRMLMEPAVLRECVPVVFGDAALLVRVAKACSLPQPEYVLKESEWKARQGSPTAAVIDCSAVDAAAVRPGEISAACGRAAYRYIEAAIESALAARVAAVATAPVHK